MNTVADLIRTIGVVLGLLLFNFLTGWFLQGDDGIIYSSCIYICGVVVFCTNKILRRLDAIKDQLKKNAE